MKNSLDELKTKEKLSEEEIKQKNRLESGIKEMKEKIKLEQERDSDYHDELHIPVEYCLDKNKNDINKVVEALFKSLG